MAVLASESVTLTVIALLPVAVGLPEMMPVAAAREKPLGRVPVAMDHW